MEDKLNNIDVNNDLSQFEEICGPCHPFIYLDYVVSKIYLFLQFNMLHWSHFKYQLQILVNVTVRNYEKYEVYEIKPLFIKLFHDYFHL